MKKILVLYASYGNGHKSIGLNIENYYKNLGYEVESIDVLSYSLKILGPFTKNISNMLMTKFPSIWSLLYFAFDNRVSSSIYQKCSLKLFDNKELKKKIIDFKPDLVFATHFYGSGLIAKYEKENLLKTKLITIVTDYKAHDAWLKDIKNTDAIVVSNESEKKKLLKCGFNENQIQVSGIPILLSDPTLNKAELLKKFKLKGDRPIILFFLGGGEGATNNLKYFKALVKENVNADILLIAGKNEKAKLKALEIVNKYHANNVLIHGFVNNINDFYSVCDFVITKPGGAQSTECLYYRKPMILIKGNGGQEIANKNFLIKNGYALGFVFTYGFVKQVKRMLNEKKLLRQMVEKIDNVQQEKAMERLYKISKKIMK